MHFFFFFFYYKVQIFPIMKIKGHYCLVVAKKEEDEMVIIMRNGMVRLNWHRTEPQYHVDRDEGIGIH